MSFADDHPCLVPVRCYPARVLSVLWQLVVIVLFCRWINELLRVCLIYVLLTALHDRVTSLQALRWVLYRWKSGRSRGVA